MQMRPSRVLAKLRAGKVASCVKLNLADPRVAEIAALCGVDCVWLNREHVPNDLRDIEDQTRVANRERFVIVQIEDPEPVPGLDQLAQINGIDMLVFGPADFSHGIGDPDVTDAVVARQRQSSRRCRPRPLGPKTTGRTRATREWVGGRCVYDSPSSTQ